MSRSICGCVARWGSSSNAHGRLLPQLVAYLEAAGASTVTSELAISWARLPAGVHPQPLGGQAVDRARVRRLPADDRPGDRDPAGRRVRRSATSARPRICGPSEDICRLLEAARALRPPLRAASYEALFGLLAVTGMRIGEAIALEPRRRRPRRRRDHDPRTDRQARPRRDWCRCTPRPPGAASDYATTRDAAVPEAEIDARSFSPAPAPASIAAASPRRCARSRPRSACGPRPSTRPRTRSQAQLRCPDPDRLAAIRRPRSTSRSRCCRPTSGTSARRRPTGI